MVKEAELHQVSDYLAHLPALPLWLVRPLQGRTWLAVPANASDATQRIGYFHPVVVRLVERASPLDRVIARWDGASYWFEDLDRRADPIEITELRESLANTAPEHLSRKGMTPELKQAYHLAYYPFELEYLQGSELHTFRLLTAEQKRDAEHKRIQRALHQSGGTLQDVQDRGDFWWVEWSTSSGERHSSAVSKADLTVLTAGICLSGMDSDFDLQALVGVVERAHEEAYW